MFSRSFATLPKGAALTVCLSLLAVLSYADGARADIGAAARSVPAAELVGKGRMSFLGLKLFDAELYAPGGDYRSSGPFALKLTYLRDFKSRTIVESSVKEIRRQGGVSERQIGAWQRQMEAIFPDITAGQTITGVRTSGGGAVFYLGNRKLGTIADPAFASRFYDIWLGSSTRNPGLRARLVGAGS